MLAWKRGNAILTAGPTKVSPDERIRLLEGYNLEIREVQTTDAGDYICHIATLQPKEITHTLEVLGESYSNFFFVRSLAATLRPPNFPNLLLSPLTPKYAFVS